MPHAPALLLLLLPFLRALGHAQPDCSWCTRGNTFPGCGGAAAGGVEKGRFRLPPPFAFGRRRFPYWRPEGQTPLGHRDANVVLAVLVQHGAARDADDYASYMAGAVAHSGLPAASVMVIGPQFGYKSDPTVDPERDIYWAHHSQFRWNWGGNSSAHLNDSVASFRVLDEIVRTLRDATLYPNLRKIVVAGHSAGGQTVQRYSLFTHIPPDRDEQVGIQYFIANPSSMVYLDATRPVLPANRTCSFCVNTTLLTDKFSFAIPEASACNSTYNMYGYGLEGPVPPYVERVPRAAAIDAFRSRDVVFVSGESDVCNLLFMQEGSCTPGCNPYDALLDKSCEGLAQGYCRKERMHAYVQHLREFYGNQTHALISVPGVGHSGCGIFHSDEFVRAAFSGLTPMPPASPKLTVATDDYTYACIPKDACRERDTKSRSTSPGTVLMGGGADVDAAFKWQISRSDGGNFLVLRESGTDAYNKYIYDFGGVRTAATLILNNREAASDSFVLQAVENAHAIFFAGGDQSKYLERINGTALQDLLRSKVEKVTIGGTSAGCAIQGEWIYSGKYGSAVSDETLEDPYNKYMADFTSDLIVSPSLASAKVITDTHFVVRKRMGRLVGFIARIQADGLSRMRETVRGVGVDQETALLVTSEGKVTVVGDGTAYMCSVPNPGPDRVCEPGTPLTVENISCERLRGYSFDDPKARDLDTFDLYEWKGSGVRYEFDVEDGRIEGNAYGPRD